jgi:hypothetical protein
MPLMYSPENVVRGGEAAGQIMAETGRQRTSAGLQVLLQSLQGGVQLAGIQAQRDMQLKALEASKANQERQIAAQFAMQQHASEEAFRRTAIDNGFAEELKQADFERTSQSIRERAEAEANLWTYQFTAKQKQQQAREHQLLASVQSDPTLTDSEKARKQAEIKTDFAYASIPSRVARDPNTPPDYYNPYGVYSDPNNPGIKLVGGGRGQPRVVESPEDKAYGQFSELATRSIGDVATKMSAGYTVKVRGREQRQEYNDTDYERAFNGVIRGLRKSNPAFAERLFGPDQTLMQAASQPAQLKTPGRKRGTGKGVIKREPATQDWWGKYEESGVDIPDDYKALPQEIAEARFTYDALKQQYRSIESMPPEARTAYFNALTTLKKHRKLLEQ